MAVRNELVDATMATRANGSTARKGAELSSRGAHVAVGGARPGSGGSTSTSAACAWRSGAGQGEMPRRARHTLALAAWTYSGGTISVPGDPEYVNGRQISAELFSTLGISPVQGRAFRPDEDRPGAPPVAIISYGLWQRDFGGDPSAIGRPLV